MRIGIKRAHPTSRSLAAQADESAATRWVALALELIVVAALLALAVLVATWFSQPSLRISAAEPAATRYLAGFWEIEHTDAGSFRWSQMDATIRLFGLEQRAPVLLAARLSASRKPGLPLTQLTIQDGSTALHFPIRREWRHYMLLLPAPPRDAEGRTIQLHSLADPPYDDSRDLGLALDWFAATPQPRTSSDRLPDAERLAFLVALGVLGYAALRRIGVSTPIGLLLALAAAIVLSSLMIAVPHAVAYWLPNLWLLVLAGWLALLLPGIVPWLHWRRARSTLPAALVAVGVGVLLLPLQQPWSSAAGWALLLSGAIMLAATLPALPTETLPLRRRTVALALAAITLLALALRLVGLDGLPLGMWRDEARHGLLALRILNDPAYRPVYVPDIADIPALLFYLAAVPISFFGAHPWTVRLVPALAGALTPLALYFAARPLFGTRAALLAAALLAISVWQLGLSRLAFAATLGPPLTLLAIGLVWRALGMGDQGSGIGDRGSGIGDNREPENQRTGEPENQGTSSKHQTSNATDNVWARYSVPQRITNNGQRTLQAALAGAATGLAIYTYHPSRLTPLIVAIVIALRLGWNKRAWRVAAPRLALLVASAALVAWPLIIYGISHRASFSQRIGQTSIFNSDSLAGRAPLARIEENVRLNLGIWNERGDRIGRHNLPNAPMLDPLTGAAFVIGAGLVLTRLRDRRALLLTLWVGVALIPGIFSIEAPHAVRTVEVIAPTMLLAAVGMCTLVQPPRHQERQEQTKSPSGVLGALAVNRSGMRVLVGGLIIVVLALNATRYFVAWPQSPKAYEEFFVAETHAGELIQRLVAQPEIRAGGYQIYVPASAQQNDVVRYLTSGIALETFAHSRLNTPAGDHALLIDIGDQTDNSQALRQALGNDARLLGTGPISPLSGKPEWTIYGRGPAVAQAVARVLNR